MKCNKVFKDKKQYVSMKRGNSMKMLSVKDIVKNLKKGEKVERVNRVIKVNGVSLKAEVPKKIIPKIESSVKVKNKELIQVSGATVFF